MERQDKDLAWMLRFENIAWYEDGAVSILDRRVYPIEVNKVVCRSHQEVAEAIKEYVLDAPEEAQRVQVILLGGGGWILAQNWDIEED